MAERGNKRVLSGTVVSDKMDKTIVVRVERRFKHREYQKYVTRSKKVHAHDEQNECRQGDRVEIVESRPLSRNKRWRVRKIVERAPM